MRNVSQGSALVTSIVLAASACSSEGTVGGSYEPAASATPPAASGPGTTSGPSAARSSSPSAAATGDAGIDAALLPPARVPVFIAQGSLGRQTISCDDGRTWIADHSEAPDAHCNDANWPINIECAHNEWAAIGMAEADGYFLSTFGWGHPGMVRRTEDGIHWEDVYPGHTLAGMAFGNGHLVGLDRPPVISTAAGAAGTWVPGGDLQTNVGNVRDIGFTPDSGGRFIAALETGTTVDIQVSADNGQTWHSSPGLPVECGHNVAGIVSTNGVTIVASAFGSVCRSTDGGENWTNVPVNERFTSNPIVADGMFTIWSEWTRFQSKDGLTWSSAQGTADGRIGPIAHSSSGTWVAVQLGSQYDQQQFFRSIDGLVWESLPKTAFVGSHPIRTIQFGTVKPSATCSQ